MLSIRNRSGMVKRMENESIWKIDRKKDASDLRNRTKPFTGGHRPSRNMVLTAGLFYLGLILFGIYAQITRMGLIVSGDSAGTVEKIIASNGMLQVAFVSDVLGYACYVLLGITCYIIFKRINNKIAMVMLLFVIIGGSYALVNMLNVLDAIQLFSGAVPLTGAEKDMVVSHLNTYDDGSSLAQILGWGPWLIPLGYLGYRSGFVPRMIGIILMVGGVGLTIQGFQYFLLPSMGDLFVPGVVISTIGEFSICGWFLYRGIKGFDGAAEKEELIERNDSNAPL
jgi:hypothetical protein